MAGVPGKGGAAGRSGRKPGSAAPNNNLYPVKLPADLYKIVKAEGAEWVRGAIREKAEREAS